MRSTRLFEERSKSTSFALLGAILAFGAPLGLVVVRSFVASTFPSFDFVAAQINADALTYGYLTFSTLVVFVVLGRTLGAREDTLAKTSITDPLTRLHNRRHIDTRLHEELARAVRHDLPLALLLIDVDHLKEINDRGGHEAGDTALTTVGETLQRTCRSTDVPARYGGDEFVVLLPSTTAEQAQELCARLRTTLERTAPKLPIPLTVSIGIADLHSAAADGSPEKLFEAADAALYAAKRAGRNRAVLADGAAPPKLATVTTERS